MNIYFPFENFTTKNIKKIDIVLNGDKTLNVMLLQYFLTVMSIFYATIPSVSIDGIMGPKTRTSVMEFQKTMKLPVTGLVDEETWDILYRNILGIIVTIPPSATNLPILKYPSIEFKRGMGLEEPGVFLIQELLAYISIYIKNITNIPYNLVDGEFGPITEVSVMDFQKEFGLILTGIVDETTWNKLIEVYQNLKIKESITNK